MSPRPIRPKDEPCGGAKDLNIAPGSKANKRRAVSSACIPCRKRKSKCDGALPSCSTCTAVYCTECSYDSDNDHRRRGDWKRNIQSLQDQNDALDVVVDSLRTLPEVESISLLHSLRSGTSPDTLAATIRSSAKRRHGSASQTLKTDLMRQMSPMSLGSQCNKKSLLASREGSLNDTPSSSGTKTPAEGSVVWFSGGPQDSELVEHLLQLYFSWIHPFYQFFSPDHFIHDMADGELRFCSGLLVNAVLSFACHYSDRHSARSAPDEPATAGDDFFAEAKRLLDVASITSLTTVQALAVMSVRETSQGRESNGYQYAGRCVRMALEMGLHLSASGVGLQAMELEVRKITFWGVFNLETICSIGAGRLSQLPRAAIDVQKPTIYDRTECQKWQPYKDMHIANDPRADQESRLGLFMEQLSQLSELASNVINTFYAPRERFTIRRLANAYAQYQEWYHNLPNVFRLENTTLPHVLALHMYYLTCILHLFRPYIRLDLEAAGLFPRNTCTACANEISELVNTLRSLYGLRCVCLTVTSLLLSASTIHLINLPSESAASYLTQGIRDLGDMAENHQFAARCIETISDLAVKWNITLPQGTKSADQPSWPSATSSTFGLGAWAPFSAPTTPVAPQHIIPSSTMNVSIEENPRWRMYDGTNGLLESLPPETAQPHAAIMPMEDWHWQ